MEQGGTIGKSKQLFQRLVPTKVMRSQLHRRTFQQFAAKIGLVYFGYVDQRDDEHSLIRGLTVSTKHRDNHYCIGSFESYDIALVERVDTIHHPGKQSNTHHWIVMTFDLHRAVDLPHLFVGLHAHGDVFYAYLHTKFSNFNKVLLEQSGTYDHKFLKHYTMFTKPEQALSAERLFSPAIAKVIADQFDGLSIEISEGTIYVYAENQRPTTALLDKMLSRGIWLAKAIDVQQDSAIED
jgi:hypothetical protein